MGQDRRSSDPPRAPLAPDPRRRRLTPREREIALLVAEGLKDRAIANRLGLSVSTIALNISRVRRRLRLKDRRELAAWVAARYSSANPGRPLLRLELHEPS